MEKISGSKFLKKFYKMENGVGYLIFFFPFLIVGIISLSLTWQYLFAVREKC